jgi:S1-C subfamily serine protease
MNRNLMRLVVLLVVAVFVLGLAVVGVGAAYLAREAGAPTAKQALAQLGLSADSVAAAPPQQDDAQDEDNADEAGILIASVAADSPAADAGLRRGDILLRVNDVAVNTKNELSSVLADLSPGDTVTLSIRRGDAEQTLTATLGEHPNNPDTAYLGIGSCGGGERFFHKGITIPREPGAMIIRVVADSPAAQAGLQEGDHILSVDGTAIDADHSLADLIGAHQPGDSVTLRIARANESEASEHDVTVTLGDHPDNPGNAYLGVEYMPFIVPFGLEGEEGAFPFFHRQPFMPDFLPDLTLPEGVERAVVIGGIAEDGPAAAAGLQAGDIITALDGEPIESLRAFRDAIAAHQPGDTVTLTVYRADGDTTEDLQVTLGDHPDNPGAGYLGVTRLGFYVQSFQSEGFEDGSGIAPALPFPFPRPEREAPFGPDNEA